MNKILVIILMIGIIYRLFLTANGNFLFNMDNGRDFVDVRELVELKKIRLTGPTSAIAGVYNGPIWYYLLAIAYMITRGDPYSAILMLILFWSIGGFFLLKLIKPFGLLAQIAVGFLWVASDYIVLANLYSFNPNPVLQLTPLFIYLLCRYIERQSILIIPVWFLAGAFFNFEMNAGIFMPVIIVFSLIFSKKRFLKDRYFWMGFGIFLLTLFPQVLFDFKHQFIMSKSILRFLSENKGIGLSFLQRFQIILNTFYQTFSATMMNKKILSLGLLFFAILPFSRMIKQADWDSRILVPAFFILIPLIGYLILPVNVNAWHLGGEMAAALVLIGFELSSLWRINFFGKIFSLFFWALLIFYSLANILNFFINDWSKNNLDPSLYKNEISAIDYVYNYANGQNFKAYTYLPSVYDYPYQYLFWWYGQKKYGYVPYEYAYSPNKPPYIPSQNKFQGSKNNYFGLVFLIKEPDRNFTRSGWEGAFIHYQTIKKQMLGSIEVEVKKEY